MPLPPPTWEFNSELSLVATGGNTSVRTLAVGGDLTHRTDRTSTRGSVAFLTNEADAVTSARSLTLQARHAVKVGRRIEVFGRGSYARDRFAGIDERVTTAAGAAYTPGLPKPHLLTAEGSIGFTSEQRLAGTDLRFATATGALTYVWTISPDAELREEVGVIADLQEAENWRGTNAAAITVTLSRLLSLKASHVIEYRRTPVPGFRRQDMRTAVALVFSLQRRPGPR